MDRLDKLLTEMIDRELISKIALSIHDVSDSLSRREDAEFSGHWMEIFERVNKNKPNGGASDDFDLRVTRLRELAYTQVYERWNSSDLAAFVSDDFGLIGDALAMGLMESGITKLLDVYCSGMFPVEL